MADAVIAPSATTRLRYQFTVDGAVSDVPTVTATETEPDGTINNLSNPTLQNDPADPSYILDYSNADEGDYYVKFLTSDTNCDQYPGVAFYVTVEAGGAVDLTPVMDVLDKFHFTGGVGVEKVNSYDADANADLATLLSRTAGGVTVVSQSTTPTGTTRIGKGKRYTGSDRLTYTSDTQRDLSTNTLVALQFNGKSFTADSITGSAGAWTILVPLTNVETDALFLGTFDGELSVYDTSPNPDQEIPELAKFKVTVYANV